MNLPAKQKPPRYVTCCCQHCGGHIEFDANELTKENGIVPCPHCGSQTELFPPRENANIAKEPELKKPQIVPAVGISNLEAPIVINHRHAKFLKGGKVVLTPVQSKSPEGQELIKLLMKIEQDGFITENGVLQLHEWLETKSNSGIRAISYLSDLSRDILACGKLSMDNTYEMQLAVERVLPKPIRDRIKRKRYGVEAQLPASETTLANIRQLGGVPRLGMTRSEAFTMQNNLESPATKNQIAYIRRLGGNPSPQISFQEASDLIDELLHTVKATKSQIQYVCDLDRNPPAELPRADVGIQMNTNHFTIVELRQGTAEWLEWRHNGIGASDASTIMGENRFKSAAQLLEEKRGPVQDYGQNTAMARGAELEPEARRLYVAKTGREVRPACLQSTLYDWLRASLDGLGLNHDAVVEIKCGQSAYRTASQTRSVPDYYYGQLQHILAVTGLDSLDFWCYWPGCPALLIPVPRNDSYIERLLEKELEFWNLVQQR